VWIWSVTLVALAVAAYEFAQLVGWKSPVPDLYVSGVIVAALLAVFAYVFARTRTQRHPTPSVHPGTNT